MSRKANNNVHRSYGHDNRYSDDHNIRRVSFQNNQGRISKNKSKWKRDRFGWDEDVDMGGNTGHGHQNQGFSRGGFRGGRGGGRNRAVMQFIRSVNHTNSSGWFQIKIILGARYNREVVLGKLTQHLGQQKFFPICYQILNQDSVFYVERFQDAQLLLSCTRKISFDDGSLMLIKIREARPPLPLIDDSLKEKMKKAMANRYIAANKALDLTRFTRDPEFIDGVYCTLSRPTILAAAIKIIGENIPDLVALKLSSNAIRDFDVAGPEIKNLKSLKILHINDNNITSLHTLSCFKPLDISELAIEKNPIANNFSDKAHFVRYGCRGVTEVRKRFPKLTKLDNMELTPIVAFDVAEEVKQPPPQAAFICHPEGRAFVKEFLSQYFMIYDSENRKDLEQAYESNASFSLTIPKTFPYGPRLNTYLSDSRNLLRVADFPRRRNQLHKGRAVIVDVLSRLPRTQHDLMSFAVDLPFFTPALIQLSVTGLFRERGTGSPVNWPLRHFSRTFLIVPVGSGFCIVNDVLFITNASEEQKEVAFKTEPPKPAELAASPAASMPVAPVSSPVVDESVKLQMVQAIAEQTGMNIEWSKKCLDETSWDFQRALWTFAELQKKGGVIPAEAFIK